MTLGWGARRCADVPIDSAGAASCFPDAWVADDSRRCAVGVASRSAAAASCFPGVWVAGDSRRCAEGVASRFQGARVVGDSMRFPGE
jgi:hypothetical protein